MVGARESPWGIFSIPNADQKHGLVLERLALILISGRDLYRETLKAAGLRLACRSCYYGVETWGDIDKKRFHDPCSTSSTEKSDWITCTHTVESLFIMHFGCFDDGSTENHFIYNIAMLFFLELSRDRAEISTFRFQCAYQFEHLPRTAAGGSGPAILAWSGRTSAQFFR